MTLAELFPDIRPWVENLPNVWPGVVVKPNFASWQVWHIVSLALLGGTSILINLRIIGVGLTEERPSEIERNLRPWLNLGVAGVIISGVLTGAANAGRLYDSGAFTIKLICLVAALMLTYGASSRVARADGEVAPIARFWTLAGTAIWAAGLLMFVTEQGISAGVFHVITAGGLIVALIVQARERVVYLAGLGLLVALHQIATHVLIAPDDYDRLNPANTAFAGLYALWMSGTVAYRLQRGPDSAIARLIGYAAILVWVTAAAAGRWIAFA